MNVHAFTRAEQQALREGRMVDVEGSRYAVCHDCRCVVKLNKRFFGSAHLCEP